MSPEFESLGPEGPLVSAPLYVRGVKVKKLFGEYTYDLRLAAGASDGDSRLIVLYGDNGSGKTTILKLIFHLLAHGTKSGHRTFVAKIPFESFAVELGNEIVVTAYRPPDKLTGDFRMEVRRSAEIISHASFYIDENGKVKSKASPADIVPLFESLAQFKIGLYFLSDNRQIITNSEDRAEEEETEVAKQTPPTSLKDVTRYLVHTTSTTYGLSQETSPLEIALRRASTWATQQVLKGSNKGEQDVNAVYTEILSRIADAGRHSTHPEGERSKESILHELDEQAQRSIAFSQYDLIAPLDIQQLSEPIRRATHESYPMLVNVISPYIDGLRARLNALQPVYDSIDAFCRIINSFYKNKHLTFSLRKGPSVVTHGGLLSPSALSSGERQLLLLFCNILVAKDQNSIFIIDEPELSLNVKWQRNLVNTLLEFTKGSHVQFLLATHSIELLARHKNHVAKLEESELVSAGR